MGSRCGHVHFPAKSGPKNQLLKISISAWISHHRSIDNNLLSSHKKIQPSWPKMAGSINWPMINIFESIYINPGDPPQTIQYLRRRVNREV